MRSIQPRLACSQDSMIAFCRFNAASAWPWPQLRTLGGIPALEPVELVVSLLAMTDTFPVSSCSSVNHHNSSFIDLNQRALSFGPIRCPASAILMARMDYRPAASGAVVLLPTGNNADASGQGHAG